MKTQSKKLLGSPAVMKYSGIFLFVMSFVLVIILAGDVRAQDNKADKKETKTQRFCDEDGDGFNDLLPDSDGDGIPDMIDPDFKGHSAESLYMHRYMHGQTIEAERNQFRHLFQHGEPGQYGPNDSTGHGHQGGRHGSGGIMGGDKQGLNLPDSKENDPNLKSETKDSANKQKLAQVDDNKQNDNGRNEPKDRKVQKNQK